MITKYGFDVVIIWLIIAGGLVVGAIYFVPLIFLRWVIIGITGVLTILVLNFFRDPDRQAPDVPGAVISPADGRIVLIKDLHESEFLQQDAVQVSIFMSPLDVHVNRFPVDGTVQYFKHIPGEFLVAFDDKSSERNERTHIGLETTDGWRVLFKQIAGTVARRIVADLKVGQPAVKGERFGMIRFGSRVDVIMPKGTEVKVKLQDRVSAGETILAIRH